jgi:5,5'-dehydrodivanillate O-demethylase
MRQFWHAVYRSQDLPAGHARPIRIMSEDYTLYRGHSGTAQITLIVARTAVRRCI